MKLYLAGPMRGLPDHNYPAFRKAAQLLMNEGHQVFSPVAYNESIGIGPDDERHANPVEGLSEDLRWICTEADGLVIMPLSKGSRGVKAEAATAVALGKPVWSLATFLLYGPGGPTIQQEAGRDG